MKDQIDKPKEAKKKQKPSRIQLPSWILEIAKKGEQNERNPQS